MKKLLAVIAGSAAATIFAVSSPANAQLLSANVGNIGIGVGGYSNYGYYDSYPNYSYSYPSSYNYSSSYTYPTSSYYQNYSYRPRRITIPTAPRPAPTTTTATLRRPTATITRIRPTATVPESVLTSVSNSQRTNANTAKKAHCRNTFPAVGCFVLVSAKNGERGGSNPRPID